MTNADMVPPNKGFLHWWVISPPPPETTPLVELVAQELQRSCIASPVTPETTERVSGGKSTMSPTGESTSYEPFSVPEDSAIPSKVDRTSGSAIFEPNVPQCSCTPSPVTPEAVDSESVAKAKTSATDECRYYEASLS